MSISLSSIVIMIAILCYLTLMLIIGVRFSKTNTSTDDFYLGGRKLGPLVTAMSAEASDMSSWLLMGLPGVAYLTWYLAKLVFCIKKNPPLQPSDWRNYNPRFFFQTVS